MEHHAYTGTDPDGTYRRWLERRARKASRIVEVGVLAGKTTIRLARATRGTVWAVDHWQGVPGDPLQEGIYRDPEASEEAFHRRMADYVRMGRVKIVKMDSQRAASYLGAKHGRTFDLVFLDADHAYHSVRADIIAWRSLVRRGGILCGHDISWPGVRRAVEELIPRFRRGAGSLWWVRIK